MGLVPLLEGGNVVALIELAAVPEIGCFETKETALSEGTGANSRSTSERMH
jgi:hypothetical protein